MKGLYPVTPCRRAPGRVKIDRRGGVGAGNTGVQPLWTAASKLRQSGGRRAAGRAEDVRERGTSGSGQSGGRQGAGDVRERGGASGSGGRRAAGGGIRERGTSGSGQSGGRQGAGDVRERGMLGSWGCRGAGDIRKQGERGASGSGGRRGAADIRERGTSGSGRHQGAGYIGELRYKHFRALKGPPHMNNQNKRCSSHLYEPFGTYTKSHNSFVTVVV